MEMNLDVRTQHQKNAAEFIGLVLGLLAVVVVIGTMAAGVTALLISL